MIGVSFGLADAEKETEHALRLDQPTYQLKVRTQKITLSG
jgi:hypothetical protein